MNVLGTFWLVFKSFILNEDNLPKYFNVIKCERLRLQSRVGEAKAFTVIQSESSLLNINDNFNQFTSGELKGFIPSVNDFVEIYYSSADTPISKISFWNLLLSGRIILQPYTQGSLSGVYTFNCSSYELLSNNKKIGNTIEGGVNFKGETYKNIIEKLIKAQQDIEISNIRYQLAFDKDIEEGLQTRFNGVRMSSTNTVEGVLERILRSSNLQLFITSKNSGDYQTIKYNITDKYYNPDYKEPFFTITQNYCQVELKRQDTGLKQASRYYCIVGNEKIVYSETYFNLLGLAGLLHEEAVESSFFSQDVFTSIKNLKKGIKQENDRVNIKQFLDNLAFGKVRNDIILSSIIQVKINYTGLEIPDSWKTAEGESFFGNKTAIIDVGMRFTLDLKQYKYKKDVMIVSYGLDVSNGVDVVLEVVPIEILEVDKRFFTLPSLVSQYKADNGKDPTAKDLIQYIYKNPNNSEAKFQLSLLNPIGYNKGLETDVLNTVRIFTKYD